MTKVNTRRKQLYKGPEQGFVESVLRQDMLEQIILRERNQEVILQDLAVEGVSEGFSSTKRLSKRGKIKMDKRREQLTAGELSILHTSGAESITGIMLNSNWHINLSRNDVDIDDTVYEQKVGDIMHARGIFGKDVRMSADDHLEMLKQIAVDEMFGGSQDLLQTIYLRMINIHMGEKVYSDLFDSLYASEGYPLGSRAVVLGMRQRIIETLTTD
jgi:hypothetical protein